MYSLSVKSQIYLLIVLYMYNSQYTYTFPKLVIINHFFMKKLKILVLLKKINKGLFFNKIMVLHLNLLICVIIGVVLLIFKNHTNKLLFSNLTLTVILNILGIYWSIHENLWGGAWDWNLVEVSILLITVCLVLFAHIKSYTNIMFYLFLIMVVIYVIYNHIPIVLNVHNFANNKINKYNLLLVVTVIIVVHNQLQLLIPTIIFIFWFIQFNKINNHHLLLKYVINTVVVYYTIMKHNVNFIWFASPLFSIIKVFIGLLRYPIQFLIKNIHTNLIYTLTYIIFYQGSYIMVKNTTPVFYVYNNINKGGFITSENYNLFKKQLQPVFSVFNIYSTGSVYAYTDF